MPWASLVQLVQPCQPGAKTGRPPLGIEALLRIHSLPWFALPEPAMQEALPAGRGAPPGLRARPRGPGERIQIA